MASGWESGWNRAAVRCSVCSIRGRGAVLGDRSRSSLSEKAVGGLFFIFEPFWGVSRCLTYPHTGWVPNYVRINLRARYIHEMGGDNSSKLAKQLCQEIGATIATIYSDEEDELAYAACKPADCWIGLEEDGGVPDFQCDGKCGTAETWWGEQVWLWVDDMGGPLGLINRRIGDGLVGYRWRAGGSNGLNMPEGYENWNRLQGQPDNGKLKGVPGDERHAHIAGYDGMWHDVLGTDEYYPLCRMWPNRSDGFVWNGTDCKPDCGVPWPSGRLTPSTRLASIRRGRGWSHFRF